MTHTPRLLHVIEQNESDKDARCVRLKDSNGVFALVIDEKYGERFAALWNMAERLGLSTEEIKTKESMFSAAADMLKALEWYGWKVDGCRKNTLEGDRARYDIDRDGGSRAYAAIRKARGEE